MFCGKWTAGKSAPCLHYRMGTLSLIRHRVRQWAPTIKSIINTIYSAFLKKIYYILTIAVLSIRIVSSLIKH
jgi:hypothetical protein